MLLTAGSWKQSNPRYEHVLYGMDWAEAFIADQSPAKGSSGL